MSNEEGEATCFLVFTWMAPGCPPLLSFVEEGSESFSNKERHQPLLVHFGQLQFEHCFLAPWHSHLLVAHLELVLQLHQRLLCVAVDALLRSATSLVGVPTSCFFPSKIFSIVVFSKRRDGY